MINYRNTVLFLFYKCLYFWVLHSLQINIVFKNSLAFSIFPTTQSLYFDIKGEKRVELEIIVLLEVQPP